MSDLSAGAQNKANCMLVNPKVQAQTHRDSPIDFLSWMPAPDEAHAGQVGIVDARDSRVSPATDEGQRSGTLSKLRILKS